MIPNLLYLVGEDDYRLREKVRWYRQAFAEKYTQGQIEWIDEDHAWDSFCGNVLTPSLFGEKRLFLCDGFWTPELFEQATKAGFFEQLEIVQDVSTIIIIDSKPDKRLKSTKFFLGNARVESFDPLDTPNVVQWVGKYAQKRGGMLPHAVGNKLVNRCGENLWTLAQETDKLLAAADGKEISHELVETLTLPNPSLQVWDFLHALSSQQTAKALTLLETLLQSGESVYQVLAMIMREIRIHVQLRAGIDQGMGEQALASATKLHPFVVKKTLPLTRSLTMPQLKACYEHLFELDKKIKTGGFAVTTDDTQELALALDQFILTMSGERTHG